MKKITALAAALVLSLIAIGSAVEPATLNQVDSQPMLGMDGYVQWPFTHLSADCLITQVTANFSPQSPDCTMQEAIGQLNQHKGALLPSENSYIPTPKGGAT